MPGLEGTQGRERVPHPNELIAEKWLAAFNAQDIEKLLALYDDNAKHYSPRIKGKGPGPGSIEGKDALREWWQGSFNRLPTLRYKLVSLTANDDRVFIEYIRSVEGEEDEQIAVVLEIKNGKVVASHVYHG